LCTIHARSVTTVFDRVVELALEYGTHMSAELAYRLAVNALDLIVYVDLQQRDGQRQRRVTHIIEVDSLGEGGRPATNSVFRPPHVHDLGAFDTGPSRTRDQLEAAGWRAADLLTLRGFGDGAR